MHHIEAMGRKVTTVRQRRRTYDGTNGPGATSERSVSIPFCLRFQDTDPLSGVIESSELLGPAQWTPMLLSLDALRQLKAVLNLYAPALMSDKVGA